MHTLMIIGGMGVPELLIAALIILVIFGAGKLPTVFRQLGSGIRDFKAGLNGEDDEGANPPSQIEDQAGKTTSAPTNSEVTSSS